MPAVIAHDESGADVLDGPGRREAAGRHRSVWFSTRRPANTFSISNLCSSFNQAQNEQQNNRADERVDNRGNNTGPDHNAELRQQPTSDKAADDSDDDIPDQPVAAAFNNHTGKPTGDGTDNKPNDQYLYVHLSPHLL